MLFNLDFANNTISLGVFLFFLIIDFYFLISALIRQLLILLQNSFKEAKAERERQPEIVEVKIKKGSI